MAFLGTHTNQNVLAAITSALVSVDCFVWVFQLHFLLFILRLCLLTLRMTRLSQHAKYLCQNSTLFESNCPPKTASQFVRPFLQGPLVCPAHKPTQDTSRQTHSRRPRNVVNDRPHSLALYAMRPNKANTRDDYWLFVEFLC